MVDVRNREVIYMCRVRGQEMVAAIRENGLEPKQAIALLLPLTIPECQISPPTAEEVFSLFRKNPRLCLWQ